MRKNSRSWKFIRGSLLLLACLPFPLRSQVIAIKAQKIYTVTHGVIENGIILIRDGKILSGGEKPEIPWNAEVVDYSQKVIVPGFIEAHAARGYDIANETNPLTPFITVLDNIDASHDAFATALRDGVTTMHIIPGHNTILGGKAAIVKPLGLVVEDMVLLPDSGMKISVTGTAAQTRMGVAGQLRRYLNETKEYMERLAKVPSPEEKMVSTPMSFRSPEYVKYDAIADLFRGRYQAYVYCQSPSDVIRANEFSEKYGYSSVYILGPECYKAVDFIALKNLRVILEPDLIHYERNPLTEDIKRIDIIKEFHGKAIPFALQSDPSKAQSRSLLYQGLKAMSSGMSFEEALKAITLIPAQILGIDNLVGSIDQGKLANFVVFDSEPFSLASRLEFVYIDGKKAYERNKDEKLKALMSEKFMPQSGK